jgi:hypothetical protein
MRRAKEWPFLFPLIMGEEASLLPGKSRRVLLCCCIPLTRPPLPTSSRCGICALSFAVSNAWRTQHEGDMFPPPSPAVCDACFQRHHGDVFTCAWCKKSKLRYYRYVRSTCTLEDEVHDGVFHEHREQEKVCALCEDKDEEEFLDDVISLGLHGQ